MSALFLFLVGLFSGAFGALLIILNEDIGRARKNKRLPKLARTDFYVLTWAIFVSSCVYFIYLLRIGDFSANFVVQFAIGYAMAYICVVLALNSKP